MAGKEQKYWIRDFSGGQNARSPQVIAENEATLMQGFIHTEGGLQSNYGRKAYNKTEINLGTAPVMSHTRFYVSGQPVNKTATTDQTALVVAKCGAGVWTDVSAVNSAGAAVAHTQTAADFRPIVARTAGSKDYFCQFDSYLYFSDPYAGSNSTGNKRWDGTFYCVGTASCAAGTAVSGQQSAWASKTAVRKGDAVFFKDQTTKTKWRLTEYRIATVTSDTKITLTAAGPNTSGSCAYMIARTHKMGIAASGTAASLAVATGAGLDNGTYYYKYTLKNSQTGYESNPSPVSAAITIATAGSGRQVTVSGWETQPTDYQKDQLRIYRVKKNTTTPYYFSTAINRTGITYAFAASKVDALADASLSTTTPDTDHDPPIGTLGPMKRWNDRIYARQTGAGVRNKLWFSELGNPEYFATNNFGRSAPTDTTTLAGGWVYVGHSGDWITGIVPESGAYETTGLTGGNLLILTKGKAWRWFGMDWTDFALVEAFTEGCISEDCAANVSGIIMWVGKNGPVLLRAGGNQPMPIYEKVYPPFGTPFIEKVTKASLTHDYTLDIAGRAWRDWYIFSLSRASDSVTYNNISVAYHIPTNSWMTYNLANYSVQANDFSWWLQSGDAGELYYSDATRGFIWQLMEKTGTNSYWPTAASPQAAVGVQNLWQSKCFDIGDPFIGKHIHRITICFERPLVTQNFAASLFVNGETTATAYTNSSIAIPLTDGTTGKYVYVDLPSFTPVDCRLAQLRLSGTFTVPVAIDWIAFTYTVAHDYAHGSNVG